MASKINTDGLLTIKLVRMPDRSIKGITPDGKESIWPADYSNKPTRRHRRVMLNCCYWAPVWVDHASIPSQEDLDSERLKAANAMFERYDFFSAYITDVGGWDTTNQLDYTRIAHSDAGRYTLHVRFEPLAATVVSVEAYDIETGTLIGALQ